MGNPTRQRERSTERSKPWSRGTERCGQSRGKSRGAVENGAVKTDGRVRLMERIQSGEKFRLVKESVWHRVLASERSA